MVQQDGLFVAETQLLSIQVEAQSHEYCVYLSLVVNWEGISVLHAVNVQHKVSQALPLALGSQQLALDILVLVVT